MDTKEVTLLSNCYTDQLVEIERTAKDGTKIKVSSCPEAIRFYMGGVNLADQLTGLYDIDRKFLKWWKKVYYKLLLMIAVNAWIIFKEVETETSSF